MPKEQPPWEADDTPIQSGGEGGRGAGVAGRTGLVPVCFHRDLCAPTRTIPKVGTRRWPPRVSGIAYQFRHDTYQQWLAQASIIVAA